MLLAVRFDVHSHELLHILGRIGDGAAKSDPRRATYSDQRSVLNDVWRRGAVTCRGRAALEINAGRIPSPLRNEALIRDVAFDHHREVQIFPSIYIDGGLMNMQAERKA